MKSKTWDDKLLAEHRLYLWYDIGREAFDLLVQTAIALPGYECAPSLHGEIREFNYDDPASGQRPFAFIINRNDLLFYIRVPGLKRIPGGLAALIGQFAIAKENSRGERMVRIRVRQDAERLNALLFSALDEGALDVQAELELRGRTDIPPTEIERLVKARLGQGIFRDRVIELEGKCRVTGVAETDHLRASHIKPWRDSTDQEKLDGNNGLLLAPHIDHLFDKGYISFQDDGNMIVSARCPRSLVTAWGIDVSISVGPFRMEQLGYLAHHRASVLKQ